MSEIKFIGCGKYFTRGAYTSTCGSTTRKGKIELCEKCQGKKDALDKVEEIIIPKIKNRANGDDIETLEAIRIINEEIKKLLEVER